LRRFAAVLRCKRCAQQSAAPKTVSENELEEEQMVDEEKRRRLTLSRRTFVKLFGATAGAVAIGECARPQMEALAVDFDDENESDEEEVYTISCRANCFQSCMLHAHVRNGVLKKMTPGAYPDEIYTGCCLRGLSIPSRTYSPTRIKYPLRRVGERGGDQWERITWDEALADIKDKMGSSRDTYGTYSTMVDMGSGSYGKVSFFMGSRFANAIKGTKADACYDQAIGTGASRVVGGGVWGFSSEPKGMLSSKVIIVQGANPVYSQPQSWRIIQRAKEAGARVICIDPMFSATAARSDEYIPIRPGSDLSLTLAMINRVLQTEAYDKKFVMSRTNACMLVRKDNGMILRAANLTDPTYVPAATTAAAMLSMKTDPGLVWDATTNAPAVYATCQTPTLEGSFNLGGIEVETVFTGLKRAMEAFTVEQAAEDTTIPAEKILELVDIYVKQGPVWTFTTYGIDRYNIGIRWGQAINVLQALTGNMAKLGAGFSGNFTWETTTTQFDFKRMWYSTNGYGNMGIPMTEIRNIMKTQQYKGKPYPVKSMITVFSNSFSNYGDENLWYDGTMDNIDYHVAIDCEMTDTVRHADLVLPVCFWTECEDIRANYANPYLVMNEKAIEPLGESKPDNEIFALIADTLGYATDFPNKTAEEWSRDWMTSDTLKAQGITYERLCEEKAIRMVGTEDKPFIRGEEYFLTPSGMAELYCEFPLPRLDYGQDWKTLMAQEHYPAAAYPSEAWPGSEQHASYPLVFIQEHTRFRTHSQYFDNIALRELDPEPILDLSAQDAMERGIADNDVVEMFNDRGHCVVKARVNNALQPGLVVMPKGWQRSQFIEGSYQELTSTETNPMAVNFQYFDTLVDVRKRG